MATQEERKAETRRRLLDAAAELFAAKGVHAVSLEAIAEAADRTTGAIYAHFGGKAGLLLALLDETSREVGRDTRGALADATDLDARLEALWQTFAAHAEAGDDPWMLLEHELWLHAARHPDSRELLANRFARARDLMGASWQSWADDADRPLPLPGDELAVLVLALLFGLDMQRRVDPDAVPDELALAGLRLLFALTPDPSPT
ncbi:MAG: TetR family transcriptional regulator [Acidimicrobiales bacterium]|jgi:AcrR family transcriptional regulator